MVQRFAMSRTVRGSNPGGDEIFRTRPDRFWGPPNFLHNGYRVSFPGVKRRGRGFDSPPHLAPRLKKECSYTSTPLWALRPVGGDVTAVTVILLKNEFSIVPLVLSHRPTAIHKENTITTSVKMATDTA